MARYQSPIFVYLKAMATIITYPSALEYWLSEEGIPYYAHFDRYSSAVSNKEVVQDISERRGIIQSIDKLLFPSPVHVAVPDNVKRNSTETIIFHRLPVHLPEHTFYKVIDHIYIVCPEYCFVQAAIDLSVPELILKANDLCSIYINDEMEMYGQRKRDPVTTTAKIRAYLRRAGKLRGIIKARSIIPYVSDRSNSPMESKLAVLAALPLSRGGYGVIKPQLNQEIKLTKTAADYLGYAICCCDMVWKKQKVVLEYDSNLSHLEIQQHFKDKKRVTALNIAGYKVISLTAEQIREFRNVETAFLRVRSALGMRTPMDRWKYNYKLRERVVKDILLQKDQNPEREYLQHSPRFFDEIQNEVSDLWD